MVVLARSSCPKGVRVNTLAVFLGDALDFVAPGSPEGVNWAWVVLVCMVVEICA